MADSNSYPMISEKNWWTIREKFKASLPAIATPNYVKTLLTLSSDSSANSNANCFLSKQTIAEIK